MAALEQKIEQFFASPAIGVVGASDDPEKYGHKCYVALLTHNVKAYPINPKAKTILGNPAFPDIKSLPEKITAINVITPPPVTAKVVDDAIAAGIKTIWMQPGAEETGAIKKAEKAGIAVIHGGPCLLVELAVRGRPQK
jgi:predicted CoA-binding protein